MFQAFDYFFDYLTNLEKKKNAEKPVFSMVSGNEKESCLGDLNPE